MYVVPSVSRTLILTESDQIPATVLDTQRISFRFQESEIVPITELADTTRMLS